MFNRNRAWYKLLSGLALAALSAWATVVLLGLIHTTGPASSSAPTPVVVASPSVPPLVKPKPLDVLKRQLNGLSQAQQSAIATTVEELADPESDELDTLGYMPTFGNSELSTPQQYRIQIHPTNFGDRLQQDIKGRPVNHNLLVVLHETTASASSAVHEMLTPHPRDEDQVSYHAIVRRDGAIIYLVDPLKRAYGAGNSAFKGSKGVETVQTKKNLASSVNNFAYHISLETPDDGYNSAPTHSGYTTAQYSSLAWLVARSGVDPDRVATHLAVDQSGSRQDPRSFEMDWLRQDLALQSNIQISLDIEPRVTATGSSQ